MLFLLSADSDSFSKLTFLKSSFRNIISVTNSLEPVQTLYYVRPDLGPNCLQKTDDKVATSKEIVIILILFLFKSGNVFIYYLRIISNGNNCSCRFWEDLFSFPFNYSDSLAMQLEKKLKILCPLK